MQRSCLVWVGHRLVWPAFPNSSSLRVPNRCALRLRNGGSARRRAQGGIGPTSHHMHGEDERVLRYLLVRGPRADRLSLSLGTVWEREGISWPPSVCAHARAQI